LETQFDLTRQNATRVNIFKRGGDSLMGRYLHFRLHPFSYGEVVGKKPLSPDDWLSQLYVPNKTSLPQEPLERLFLLSGFPEPFLSGDPKILNLWRRGRTEKIVREDLRDLSRIPELSQVEMLVSLLPGKVGSPLSVQSLREDLEVAHDTVKRWPLYLYDWTEVDEAGHRYENMMAVHLQKACDYWTDIGEGSFELFYLRNKEKQEIDFLIAKNKKPWIAIETKYADKAIQHQAVDKLTSRLNCKFAQVVFEDSVYRLQNERLVVSANRFLSGLP
jgi:uncharacterized protein